MISMLKITKGNNSTKMLVDRLLFISACRLVMLYICAKFLKIISNGIKVIELTQFLWKGTKGNNSAKNADGATVVNLCTSSGHA